MIVVKCDCGREVEFRLPEGTTTPVHETCDCGQPYELTVRKLNFPQSDAEVDQ